MKRLIKWFQFMLQGKHICWDCLEEGTKKYTFIDWDYDCSEIDLWLCGKHARERGMSSYEQS